MMTPSTQTTWPLFFLSLYRMARNSTALSGRWRRRQSASLRPTADLRPRGMCVLLALYLLVATLLTAQVGAAVAAEAPAGKVAAVAGQVTAAGSDGAIRPLGKDDPVFSGDIISTGPNSRARIVFSDNGVIFLRPSTRFVIKSYQHKGSAEKDESEFSLVRGGFRSVTGAIGHSNPKNYRVDTPVATIGIRGTDHEGRFCAGDCADLVDIGVAEPPDGLYTGTNEGKTVVGGKEFGAGQYGYTTLGGPTTALPQPPPILIKDPMLRGSLTDSGGSNKSSEGNKGGAAVEDAGFEVPAKPSTTQSIDCPK